MVERYGESRRGAQRSEGARGHGGLLGLERRRPESEGGRKVVRGGVARGEGRQIPAPLATAARR